MNEGDAGANHAPHGVGSGDLSELLDTVLDRSGTGVMAFDGDLRLTYLNEVAARVGGHAAEAHTGLRLVDLYPDMAAQVDPMLARVLRDQQPARNEELVWESPQPPHDRRYWLISYVPLATLEGDSQVAAIYVETTAARRAHERLATLLDALPTFVGMCTPEGVLVEANQATLAATAMHHDELIGMHLADAPWWSHDPGGKGRVLEAVARAQRGEASRFDAQVRVGERSATIDFQLVPIVERGAVTALVPSALEISERAAERDRLQALAALSAHLNDAVTTERAATLVVAHARAAVDATFVNVALLDPERRELRVIQALADQEVADRWATVALEGIRTPFHRVIETGEPVFVDRAARLEHYPDMVADTDRVGLDTTASVPLRDASGEVFGVIGVGWDSPLDDERQVRPRLELLADLCSHALRRVQRTETQDRFVRELQDEVLAAPDVARNLDIALTYEPAQADIGFGGDWYDVIEVGESCTAVVVGDVAGHGITAAARMTEAKATIRALVLTLPHDEVIPAATRSLGHLDSGYVATVAVAWIDTEGQSVEWRLAGHPPPVLRTPDGRTELLAGAHHPPIGMPTDPRAQTSAPFPAGSLLVLYTDGLVERRSEDIDVGLERMRAIVEALPDGSSATEVRDAVLRELHVGESDDDVAIVVVRNR